MICPYYVPSEAVLGKPAEYRLRAHQAHAVLCGLLGALASEDFTRVVQLIEQLDPDTNEVRVSSVASLLSLASDDATAIRECIARLQTALQLAARQRGSRLRLELSGTDYEPLNGRPLQFVDEVAPEHLVEGLPLAPDGRRRVRVAVVYAPDTPPRLAAAPATPASAPPAAATSKPVSVPGLRLTNQLRRT